MNPLDFEVLGETTDENGICLTNHPRITFDTYVECFMVECQEPYKLLKLVS
jgi:hypothetical protein